MKNSTVYRYVLGVLVAATTAIAAFSTDVFSDILGELAVTDVVVVLILFGLFVISQMGGNPVMDKLMMSRMRSERRFAQLSQTYFAAALAYALLAYMVNGVDVFLIAISLTAFLGMALNTLSAFMVMCTSKCSKPSEMEDMDGSSETASEREETAMMTARKKAPRKKRSRKKKAANSKEEDNEE